MSESGWRPFPAELAEDDRLAAAVVRVHEALLRGPQGADLGLNPDLGISLRALRRVDGWRALLLLTPWMLARLLFPDRPPDIEIPVEWLADRREDADYQVLGPAVRFAMLGQEQRGHLNFHPDLGHYLLQPICLDVQPYRDADAVFEAWNGVIRSRDENLARTRRECPLQREISRRELLGGRKA